MKKFEITLLFLCGGKGLRAAGNDKPLLAFRGKTIIEHMLTALAPAASEVLISANRNLEQYQGFGYPVREDLAPFEGPLAALASCAKVISTPWVMVCPGDNPLVQVELIDQLVDTLLASLANSEAVPDMLLVQDSVRVQPLYFLARTDCLPTMQQAMGERRAIMHWIDTLNVRRVFVGGDFPNINSLDDLKQLDRNLPGD